MKKYLIFLLILFLISVPAKKLWAEADDSHARFASILEKSNRFYESVKNYSAIFRKQENAKGKLQETEQIFLKFEKPFKIFMGWLNTDKKDLQVVYERGKHNGKLAIHKPGLGFGLLPVVFLDQKSPWVREGSEAYDIEDAGIGTFLADFTSAVAQARDANQLKVNFLESESSIDGETVEVIFDGSDKNSGYFAYRVLVFFDAKTSLPVKMQLFNWNNQLTGTYAYENLKINLAADEAEFKQQINRQLYRVYRGK